MDLTSLQVHTSHNFEIGGYVIGQCERDIKSDHRERSDAANVFKLFTYNWT